MGLFGRRSPRAQRSGSGPGEMDGDLLSTTARTGPGTLQACFEAVGEAQAAGDPVRVSQACWVVGRDLAEMGTSLGESIEGLRATTRHVVAREPDFEEMRALTVAWSEATLAYVHGLSCCDPLTGLATVAHLRERLAGLYRDRQVELREHAFVVLEVAATAGQDPVSLAQRMTQVGQTVRTVFAGQEAIGRAGFHRIVVLALRDEALAPRVSLLRRMLTERASRVWIEGLPMNEASAVRLLDELSRP